MSTLRSALFTVTSNLFALFGTLLFSCLALLTAPIPPWGHSVPGVARMWSRLWLWASGLRLEAHFEQPLEPGRGYVFLANHASWLDIPVLFTTVPGRLIFLAKRSLFRLPVFGWVLRLGGFVPVDRGDRERARDAFTVAASGIDAETRIVVFPEGTRSHDGRLLPFHRGGFLLALKSGLPIVPVGIQGTFQVKPRGRFRVCPGPVTVRFGRPIEVVAYGIRGRRQLMADVRARLCQLAEVEPVAAAPSTEGES